MNLNLVRAWSVIKEMKLPDLWAEFKNIRDWLNDHDNGIVPWNVLATNGSLSIGIRTVTASYALSGTDAVLFADSTSGAVTVTLPTAIGAQGRIFFIKRTNAGKNMVTIATSLTQTIDGGTVYYLPAQYHSVSLISGGTNWSILF